MDWTTFNQELVRTREETSAELDTLGTLSTMACFMYRSMACSMVVWKRKDHRTVRTRQAFNTAVTSSPKHFHTLLSLRPLNVDVWGRFIDKQTDQQTNEKYISVYLTIKRVKVFGQFNLFLMPHLWKQQTNKLFNILQSIS